FIEHLDNLLLPLQSRPRENGAAWRGSAAAAKPARSGPEWRRGCGRSGRPANLGWRAYPLQADTDLVSALVSAEESENRLTQREIVITCDLLLVAGNLTTTDLIGNGIRALLSYPDQLAKLRAHPELASNAVEEILRYDPPVLQ